MSLHFYNNNTLVSRSLSIVFVFKLFEINFIILHFNYIKILYIRHFVFLFLYIFRVFLPISGSGKHFVLGGNAGKYTYF